MACKNRVDIAGSPILTISSIVTTPPSLSNEDCTLIRYIYARSPLSCIMYGLPQKNDVFHGKTENKVHIKTMAQLQF